MVLRSDDFTEQGQHALSLSHEIVRRYNHTQWDVEHILLALLEMDDGVAVEVLRKLGTDVDAMRRRVGEALDQAPRAAHEASQIYATPRASMLLANAKAEAERFKDQYVGAEHILIAVTEVKDGDAPAILREFGVGQEQVYRALVEVRGGHRVTDQRAESRYRSLERFSIDLTQLARDGQAGPHHRARRGGQARHADPHAPHEEQPRHHRRGRRGQDGNRRGARSAHRLR